MTEAVIGLGSNVGNRSRALADAVAALRELGTVAAVSSVYETAPIGGPDQPDYLNMVAVVDTDLRPRALLDEMLAIEREAGRERRERWGPRLLDLDLLLYGQKHVDEPGLRVPHPHLTERRFVLEPLLEVRPEAALPDGRPLAPFLATVADQEVRVAGPAPRRLSWWRRLLAK